MTATTAATATAALRKSVGCDQGDPDQSY